MKKKSKGRQIINILLLSVLGGILGFLLGRAGVGIAKEMPKMVFPILMLLTIPLYFLAVAAHEAGHAWMGVRMGFDFQLFVVGPFLWERQSNGWRFKWNTKVNVGGGMALCVPRMTPDLPRRFGWFVAGGPLASLILAVGAWLAYLAVESLAWTSVAGKVFVYTWPLLAVISAFLLVVSALPMHIGGFSSDGARLLRLARGGDISKFDLLLVSFVSRSMAGIRPATVDIDELLAARELGEKINAPMKLYMDYFLFHAYFDRGQYEQAAHHLRQYLEQAEAVPDGMRGSVWLDGTFFFAFAEQNREKADYYWKQYKPSALIPKGMALAAEAALAALEQQNEKAEKLIGEAKAELPRMLDKGVANAINDRLSELQQRINSVSAAVA